ncbi:hypothetical protein LCS82_14150 [Vibrio harveyi]|uniref:DUF6793 family protein n=3 Tax=Vibrio harveyi TaxID=669 RepID=UPI001F385FB9|nr:DUF6793 family protein [Vibrio harveyi]
MEQSGLEVDQRFGVSIEVCDAVKSGAKLKAIRLYRKEMGASLRDAKRVIETLEKEIAWACRYRTQEYLTQSYLL